MAIEWAELDLFDQLLDRAGLTDDEQRDATRLLASFGCYLLMTSALPAPPGLPQMPAFRAAVGERCLVGLRRRLHVGPSDSSLSLRPGQQSDRFRRRTTPGLPT
jgi:hypothetical protein